MRLGIAWPDGESSGEQLDGNVVFPHLVGDDAKQMQSDRLLGIGLQYPLINTLGLRQAARTMVLNGEVQGLLQV